ncbi:pyridoxamine 5'-phosphate oxidase family protein [Nocardioides endophyticus]|uniref:Pyridoxamine 5'-phosphate oxidase family protein n=2 Tax=Nocardioides endophyticus TaxID=1353775 RepID=A0ABP8Z0S9_9ACTN
MTNETGAAGRVMQRTDRTTLKRYPERASYDRDLIDPILDEALVCHMGFVVDDQPYVIPTLCARVGDFLYLHGSSASRALRTMSKAPRVCVTASLMDGLVLARSAFFHSVNYRAVVVLGAVTEVEDAAEKELALEAFTNALVPDRWSDVRRPTEKELKATKVLRMPLDEVSLKTRNGPPADEEADLALDAWAGVIPLEVRALPAVPDPALRPGIKMPRAISEFAVGTGEHPYEQHQSGGAS